MIDKRTVLCGRRRIGGLIVIAGLMARAGVAAAEEPPRIGPAAAGVASAGAGDAGAPAVGADGARVPEGGAMLVGLGEKAAGRVGDAGAPESVAGIGEGGVAAVAAFQGAAAGWSRPAGPRPARDLGFLIRTHLDFGGETLAEVAFSNGDRSTLKAGQLFTLAAGVLYRPDAPWALEATIGYKVDRRSASNGDIGFSRFPLDVVASVATEGHRFGLGPTFHLGPSFHCDAAVCNGEVALDLSTAVGLVAQYAYSLRRGPIGLDVGVRYTLLSYGLGDGGSIGANSIGLFAGAFL